MLNKFISQLGIDSVQKIYHNLSYEELYKHETDISLPGDEKAIDTELGAVNVSTGRFTGRSPQDKYVVEDDISRDTIWWLGPESTGSNNKKLSKQAWDHLYDLCVEQLSHKDLYVTDGFAGTNENTRLSVRVVSEVAWQSHFCKNMFLRPSENELNKFDPDWTIINACKTTCKEFKKLGMNSEVFAAFNLEKKMTIIGGTWYGGEMKKGIFTMMNYYLPLRGIGAFHCSANMGKNGDTALFFGLSGTGKTTLSTDPDRALIGDDEHGWDDEGVFNFEGGCYAKCIDLSEEKEPEIYHAIRRDALLENVTVDDHGKIDFSDGSITQNTRVTYPIYHIDNIVKPVSKGTHPNNIIFLTCDAFGVLPPVSRLTNEQAMYQYLSGYTAKVAGTELGVTEPQATFSTCYGAAFLAVHPTIYAEILGEKMTEHNSNAYLVNTGWVGGAYGVGDRMDIKATRAIITAILDGSIEQAEFDTLSLFNLEIPVSLPGVDDSVLNPRNAWSDIVAYDKQATKLAKMFIKNFEKFASNDKGKALVNAGPHIITSSVG